MLKTVPKLKILELDPWLTPYEEELQARLPALAEAERRLLNQGQKLGDIAELHRYYGFHKENGDWVYREWAPNAGALFLIGEFNDWDRSSHPMEKGEDGSWEIRLPGDALWHQMQVKVHIVGADGSRQDRIPLFIKRLIQNPADCSFNGQIWEPEQPFVWKHSSPRINADHPLLIYEAHVGMAQEDPVIGTYREFADLILPRIKEAGYNTVQLMAIMEHPYYASFGYQVTNFFAASSWFGTPDDLKYLIDHAHGLGLRVLMDLVHSHGAGNLAEGIACFDGSEELFFHSGERSWHPAWGSRLFDYQKPEVLRFLLSNLRYWLEEFRFDGFRFDGVTSMLYHDHGLGASFDHYSKYFSANTDQAAVIYLQLANQLVHQIQPQATTVAEDMSGYPGMALPISAGGLGFDYRLAMGMPDFWERSVQKRDEDWDMSHMMYELTTARPGEKRIAYVESHDQALVGSQTLMFRMAGAAMYWDMNRENQNPVIDRALALHKMARLITASAGAEGYLNFMGNEFGHPEWIDFPRAENGWSYQYSRRQWSLGDSDYLRYSDLKSFDKTMLHLLTEKKLMGGPVRILLVDQQRKLIAFEKKAHIFIFNFHPTESVPSLQLPLQGATASLRTLLDTDEIRFGGQGRIAHDVIYPIQDLPDYQEVGGIMIYVPCRTGLILS